MISNIRTGVELYKNSDGSMLGRVKTEREWEASAQFTKQIKEGGEKEKKKGERMCLISQKEAKRAEQHLKPCKVIETENRPSSERDMTLDF